ncbi:hypothetical protein L6164_037072 [Bauhinia variegata]|uniref:Uncharacterized protein n=1 Tax=Bauhinia variegata TaxID=167791 RepID=A0ACB9KIZ1_BAUVA|nr:hypothetical protein L6164_037072 [Bauhinia variegata]
MEYYREELVEPVSPMGQYFNSSVLCVNIIAVLEFEVPIDDLPIASFTRYVFLPMNPRFSSVMVSDKHGKKTWKQVEVRLEDHIITPKFPDGMSTDSYEKCFNDYLSRLAMEQLPQNKPLWEVHQIIYPTSKAAGSLIFKVNHALGDGYSLMGVILSCFERADNPSLPLTFPSSKRSKPKFHNRNIFMRLPQLASIFFNSISDFGCGLLKSRVVEDDKTPIRSGDEGVEFRSFVISNMAFSMDHIKEIKSKLGVTVNDVVTGIIFYGLRLYMHDLDYESRAACSRAIVLLNTRNVAGYQSVKNMLNKDAKGPWGNKIAWLHVSLPKLRDVDISNPLQFVTKVHNIVQRKRKSFAVLLSGMLLEMQHKLQGHEAVAKNLHSTVRKTSLALSNMVGPVEQIAMANHPLKGLYFIFTGEPESLAITMMSYMVVKDFKVAREMPAATSSIDNA